MKRNFQFKIVHKYKQNVSVSTENLEENFEPNLAQTVSNIFFNKRFSGHWFFIQNFQSDIFEDV